MLYAEITALISVIVIDLVLAGDNAVVVGMAAAGLRRDIRRKAIFYGIAAAAALRIVFALFTTQLLGVLGLVLAGGLLLLWVTWKLWREIRSGHHARSGLCRQRVHRGGSRGGSPRGREDVAPGPHPDRRRRRLDVPR